MTHSPYPVGYRRPPVHTRFRKGQSGNPGGRPGPKKLFKARFEAALYRTLDGGLEALQQAKPETIVESLARQIVLQAAVEGRTSAQNLLLSLLDREDEVEADEDERRQERYAELGARFDAAVESGSVEEIVAVVDAFRNTRILPEAGNFSGNCENADDPAYRAQEDLGRSGEDAKDAGASAAVAPHEANAKFPEAGVFSGNLKTEGEAEAAAGSVRDQVESEVGSGGRDARGPGSVMNGNGHGAAKFPEAGIFSGNLKEENPAVEGNVHDLANGFEGRGGRDAGGPGAVMNGHGHAAAKFPETGNFSWNSETHAGA